MAISFAAPAHCVPITPAAAIGTFDALLYPEPFDELAAMADAEAVVTMSNAALLARVQDTANPLHAALVDELAYRFASMLED